MRFTCGGRGGNRTHQGQYHCPPHGFEGRDRHQTASASEHSIQLISRWSKSGEWQSGTIERIRLDIGSNFRTLSMTKSAVTSAFALLSDENKRKAHEKG